jgi:hypothetical protein
MKEHFARQALAMKYHFRPLIDWRPGIDCMERHPPVQPGATAMQIVIPAFIPERSHSSHARDVIAGHRSFHHGHHRSTQLWTFYYDYLPYLAR